MKKIKVAAVAAAAGLTFVIWGFSALAEPGSQDDPIVSRSYVDQRISEVMRIIDGASTETDSAQIQNEQSGGVQSAVFTPILVETGKTLYGGEGCEIIMRTGAGVIVTSTDGIVNATNGVDLKNGANAPANCLLIVPRDDGRGITVSVDSWFMVKGGYSVR